MSQSSKTPADIVEAIMSAFRNTDDSEGLTLDAIKKHLSSTWSKVPDSESILSSLKEAVDKGFLTKLDDGKYKITKAAEQIKKTAQGASSKIDEGKDKIKENTEKLGEDASSKLSGGKDKMKEIAKNSNEKVKEIEKNAKGLAEDASSKLSKGKQETDSPNKDYINKIFKKDM